MITCTFVGGYKFYLEKTVEDTFKPFKKGFDKSTVQPMLQSSSNFDFPVETSSVMEPKEGPNRMERRLRQKFGERKNN